MKISWIWVLFCFAPFELKERVLFGVLQCREVDDRKRVYQTGR